MNEEFFIYCIQGILMFFLYFFNFSIPLLLIFNAINNRINDKWLNSNLIYRIKIEIGIIYGQFRIIIYSYLK